MYILLVLRDLNSLDLNPHRGFESSVLSCSETPMLVLCTLPKKNYMNTS